MSRIGCSSSTTRIFFWVIGRSSGEIPSRPLESTNITVWLRAAPPRRVLAQVHRQRLGGPHGAAGREVALRLGEQVLRGGLQVGQHALSRGGERLERRPVRGEAVADRGP